MTHPVPEPQIDDSVLSQNGWVHDKTEKDSVEVDIVGPLDLKAYLHTKLYRDAELQKEVRRRTLGRLDKKLNVFFANRTHLEPGIDNLPLGVGREQVLWATKFFARKKFEERLEKNGVRVIDSTDEGSVETRTGAEADLERLKCAYEVDCVEVSVTEGEKIKLGSGIDLVNIDGWVGTWHHDGDVYIAGGVYPTEDIEITQTSDITEAIDLTLDIDLGIWPKPYQKEMTDLIKHVR